MTNRFSCIVFAGILLLCAAFVHAQTPVGMAPPIHFQFLNSSGQPLAGGKIWTYQGGTTTLANTYVDASGVAQNSDPIVLDATGSPSNGSTQTSIFLSNASWKFVAYDVNNVFQWQVDNVTTYFALLSSTNTWTATQTFGAQIIDTLADNQIILGAPGNQTTLDFPPPVSNITLHFPNTADTMVGRATSDNLSNKVITTPVIAGNVSSATMTNGPGTYVIHTNASTILNSLVTFVGFGSASIITPTTSQLSGIDGICVSNCGSSGGAVVQQTGLQQCNFDGATSASDYVQVSSTVAGDCHDAGASYPTNGNQILGRVLTTNGGAGLYLMDLFSPEIRASGTLYDTSGNVLGTAKFVKGAATLAGGTKVVTFTGAAVFSGGLICTANDTTGANAVAVSISDTAHLTLTGTGTDVIFFVCIGY